VVESEWVMKDSGGGGQMRTNINRDVVDVRLKLRSPAKITFNRGTSLHDKKSKNCLILRIL